MVPLEVGDLVLGQHRVETFQDVRVGVRVPEVEDLLLPGLQRQPVPAAQDPVRVRAGQVGVGVDHLRFHPQPELQAERADTVDEGVQTLRPDALVDVPVAQARVVGAPVAEPPVVQHVPFRADLGGGPASSSSLSRSRSKYTASQVFTTTGRGDPGGADGRAGARGTAPRSRPDRRRTRPRTPTGSGSSRRRPGAPRRQEQFTARQRRGAAVEAFDDRAVVPAERRVLRPDLTAAEPETLGADGEDERGVRAGAAPAVLAHVGPKVSGRRCGMRSLAQRPARSNTSVATTGTGRLRARSAPRSRRHRCSSPSHGGAGARRAAVRVRGPVQTGGLVGAVDLQAPTGRRPLDLHGGGDEARRPGGAGPVTAQTRDDRSNPRTSPAAAARAGARRGRCWSGPAAGVTRSASVARRGRRGRRPSARRPGRSPEDVDDQAHARGPQVQGPTRHGAGPGGRGAVGRGEGGGVVLGHGGSVGTSAWWTGRVLR